MNKRKIIIIVAVILALLMVCCGAFWLSFSSNSGSGMELLADALKNIDGEPTAFQPYNYTATPTSEAQPITNALVPNPGLVPPDGQVNYPGTRVRLRARTAATERTSSCWCPSIQKRTRSAWYLSRAICGWISPG